MVDYVIGGVLVTVLVAMGAFALIFTSREDAAAARKARDRKIELLTAVYFVMDEHGPTLTAQMLRRLHRDAYGRALADKALKEAAYFFDEVLLPDVAPANSVELQWVREAYGDWLQQMDLPARFNEALANTEPSDGVGYERFIASKLTAAGMSVQFTPASGDQGVDLLAVQGARKIALQCKNYAGPVGNEAVQQVYAGARFYDAQLAVVVAPNGYTVAALQLAARLKVECVSEHDLLHALNAQLTKTEEAVAAHG